MSSPTLQPDQTGFYTQTRVAKKILVVDLGFLGDTLHLVPALWEIKRHYPQSALHVLTSPLGAEVLRLAPCADRAWAIELYPGKRTLRQQWTIVRSLRRERFDLAFNFSGADRTIFMTALAGARWRMAHAAGRQHFWSGWLLPNWVPRRSTEMPSMSSDAPSWRPADSSWPRHDLICRCPKTPQGGRLLISRKAPSTSR